MVKVTKKTKKNAFLKVCCPRCRANCIIFGKSASWIKCKKCNHLLVKPGGGKTRVRAADREVHI